MCTFINTNDILVIDCMDWGARTFSLKTKWDPDPRATWNIFLPVMSLHLG